MENNTKLITGRLYAILAVCLCIMSISCDRKLPRPKPKKVATRATQAPTAIPKPTPAPTPAKELSWVHSENATFVDDNGTPLRLRGCNLGNWFLLEMWMFQIFDIEDQSRFEGILAERFGREAKDQLMEIYRSNWITERDYKNIASYGFNVVRLPFNYTLLEDDNQPMVLKPSGLEWLDKAVSLAEKYGLYIILDLHGVQGRQSTDHTTGHSGVNQLYTDPRAVKRAVWLWTELAKHYRDKPAVLAYDVINEPFGDGKTDRHETALVSIFDRIYRGIRSVDQRHIILASGTHSGIEFYGDPKDHQWEQVGFTEHFYPGLFGEKPNLKSHATFLQHKLPWRVQYLRDMNIPFLVGEFNSVFKRIGGGKLMRYYFDKYNDYGWAATMWSYKLLQRNGGEHADPWSIVWNKEPLRSIDIRQATEQQVAEYFQWFGTMAYSRNESLVEAMKFRNTPIIEFIDSPPLLTAPRAKDKLPAGWRGADVGEALPGGQSVSSPNSMTIYGSGRDIWSNKDEFRFVFKQVSGDFSFSATLQSLEPLHKWTKAGLMYRVGGSTDAAHVYLSTFPNGIVTLAWREKKGAETQQMQIGECIFPLHLQLARRGGILIVSCSSDGKEWTTKKMRLSPAFKTKKGYVGMAVCGHDRHYFTEVEFSDIEIKQ